MGNLDVHHHHHQAIMMCQVDQVVIQNLELSAFLVDNKNPALQCRWRLTGESGLAPHSAIMRKSGERSEETKCRVKTYRETAVMRPPVCAICKAMWGGAKGISFLVRITKAQTPSLSSSNKGSFHPLGVSEGREEKAERRNWTSVTTWQERGCDSLPVWGKDITLPIG